MSDAQQSSSSTILAHHWFFQPRGGERVLAELATIFPRAAILTAFATTDVAGWPEEIARLHPAMRPSRLQPLFRLAQIAPAMMPLLLPLLPWAMTTSFRQELAEARLVVVSDAGMAKCVALATAAPVAVYLHSPMRHLWHDVDKTLARLPRWARPAGQKILERLRRIDRQAAGRVERWAVNSQTTAARAAAAYRISAERLRVIHPPVVLPQKPALDVPRRGLLLVSGMEPYKNDRLAVEAARRLRMPLTVVGDGPERQRLEAAAGEEANFLGYVSDADLERLYRSHAALLFCGIEDFGIVPVEAMARGCPVVALAEGGVTETVEPGVGGVFFGEPSVDAVVTAVENCLPQAWDPVRMHAAAERFGPAAFHAAVREWLG